MTPRAHQLASKFGDLPINLDHPIGVGVERLSAFRSERATEDVCGHDPLLGEENRAV